MKVSGSNLAKVKIVYKSLESIADTEIKKAYGDSYYAKHGNIYFKPKTYPYDKKVGTWFFKDNDLYMVMNDD